MRDATVPIDIYIGCTESQALIADVLAASVRRRTASSVRFFPLHEHAVDFRMPSDPANRPGTPFSFHRFMIPEIAGFSGRAIYMDCDQIVLKDVARLASIDPGATGVGSCDTRRKRKPKATKRSSMMVIDCAEANWRMSQIVDDLDHNRYSYTSLFSLEDHPHRIPRAWNALDTYRWPFTALLHFTDKYKQPWINHNHKLGYLWMRELFHALDTGTIQRRAVTQAIAQKLVRPSLDYQIEHRLADVTALPDAVKAEDEPFIAACAENDFNNVPGEYAHHDDTEVPV